MWNTHNASRSHWLEDLSGLCVDKDLVLLQSVSAVTAEVQMSDENILCEWVLSAYDQQPDCAVAAGVKTGCTVASLKQVEHYVDHSEANANSLRVLLETHYALGSSDQTLMVLNIHATPEVPASQFLDQFEQLCQCIDHHTGPVILGGDFDTWSPDRLAVFQQYATQASLFEASMTRQGSDAQVTKHLDHVFFRGMSLRSVESLSDIQTSDYSPITATLVVD